MATDKFIKTAERLLLGALFASAALSTPLHCPAAFAQSASGRVGPPSVDAPSALCSLVGGMHAKERAPGLAGRSASSFPELLEDSAPVSTGIGYELGPGLSFQGVGVFDPSESYASLGPALSLHAGNFEFTTGMQLPVTEAGPEEPPDLYYAEFRLLF